MSTSVSHLHSLSDAAPLCEHVSQRVCSQRAPQRGLGQRVRGRGAVLYARDPETGVHHPVEDHGVQPQRDAVRGQDLRIDLIDYETRDKM